MLADDFRSRKREQLRVASGDVAVGAQVDPALRAGTLLAYDPEAPGLQLGRRTLVRTESVQAFIDRLPRVGGVG